MKLTKQRLKEIIKEELNEEDLYTRRERAREAEATRDRERAADADRAAREGRPRITVAAQYVQQHPEDAAKMLEDLLQGITLIKQQVSDLSDRFNELKPGARDAAVHGLQEVKTLLESIKI